MDTLRSRLRGVLVPAMKARDEVAVAAVRSALAALANAEAVPVASATASVAGSAARDASFAGSVVGVGAAEAARRELSEADDVAIVLAEVTERERAAAELETGAPERAARLRAEAAVLRAVLDQGRSGGPEVGVVDVVDDQGDVVPRPVRE